MKKHPPLHKHMASSVLAFIMFKNCLDPLFYLNDKLDRWATKFHFYTHPLFWKKYFAVYCIEIESVVMGKSGGGKG
jgi:hypothetical protein